MIKKLYTLVFAVAILGTTQAQAEILDATDRGHVRLVGSTYFSEYGDENQTFIMGNSSATSQYRGAFEFSGFSNAQWITSADFVFSRGGSITASVSMDMWHVATDLSTFPSANAAAFNDLGDGANYGSGTVTVGGAGGTSSLAFASSGVTALNDANLDGSTFQLGTSFGGVGFANISGLPAAGITQIDTTTTVANVGSTATSDSADYEYDYRIGLVTLNASGLDANVGDGDSIVRYEWDLDGNGSFETISDNSGALITSLSGVGFGQFGDVINASVRAIDRWDNALTTFTGTSGSFTITVVPEPGTITSFGLAAVAVGFRRQKLA